MKLFKFLSHPYPMIICFLLIMISGENFGGFYAMYILMALPFGGMHAMLAVAGIIILIANHSVQKNKINPVKQIINLIGVLFLFGSVYYFFWADKQHYNYGSFQQTVPIATMVLAAFTAGCFLFSNFLKAGTKTLLVV
jgi:nitrate reductase gamma subunit